MAFNLVINFKAQVDAAIKNVEKLSGSIDKNVKGAVEKIAGFEVKLRDIKTVIASMSVVVAAAGAGFAWLKSSADALDELADSAARIGESTAEFQEIEYGAVKAGLKIEEFRISFAKFAKNVGEAKQGQGAFKDTLKAYGIEIQDADGKLRSLNDIFYDYVDVLNATADGSLRAALAQEAFGKSGASMLDMTSKGKGKLQEYADEAHRVGAVVNDELIQQAAEFSEEWDRAIFVIEKRLQSLAGQVIAAFKNASNTGFGEYAGGMGWFQGYGLKPQYDPSALGEPINEAAIKAQLVAEKAAAQAEKNRQKLLEASNRSKGGKDDPEEKIKRVTAALQFQSEQLRRSAEDQEVYNQLQAAGVDIQSEAGQKIAAQARANYQLAKSQKDVTGGARELGLVFTSAADKILEKGFKLKDLFKSILQDLGKLAWKKGVTSQIENLVSGFDFGSLWPFAQGGIMSSSGPLPLRSYATGGIATSPQLALYGEGSMSEAIVPLPNGRSIPVEMRGAGNGGPQISIHMEIDARGAESGAADRLRMVQQETIEKTLVAVRAEVGRGGGYAKAMGRR